MDLLATAWALFPAGFISGIGWFLLTVGFGKQWTRRRQLPHDPMEMPSTQVEVTLGNAVAYWINGFLALSGFILFGFGLLLAYGTLATSLMAKP